MQINKPSSNFVKLCHASEGCRLVAYQDKAGNWTIGWGHTGKDVKAGLTITQEQADLLFIQDCNVFVGWLNAQHFNINQNQYDAILDMVYNCGPGNIKKDVAMYNLFKTDPNNFAAIEIEMNGHVYDSKGKIEKGLVTRRKNDFKLYSTK